MSVTGGHRNPHDFANAFLTAYGAQEQSTERTPDAFRQRASDLRAIVSLLNDYLRDADADVPGTLAAADLAVQGLYADDDVVDPVLHVQVRAHRGLIAAIDHLGGVAACIDAENVALATMSLLRPTVVAAGACATSRFYQFPSRTLADRPTQLPGVVPLGVNIDDLTTWLMVIALALHTSAARAGRYFGWDLRRWVKTVHPILAGWAADLSA